MKIVDTVWYNVNGAITEYKKIQVIATSPNTIRESNVTFGAIQMCNAMDVAAKWFREYPGGQFLKDNMFKEPVINSYQAWNHRIFDTELHVLIIFEISTKALSEFYLRHNNEK